MSRKSNLILLAASVLAISAWAQSPPPALNLTLPRDSVPSQTEATTAPASSAKATSTVAAAASATAQPNPANATPPDTYANETANQIVDAADSAGRPVDAGGPGKPACDDATYTQPQVHGSVGMGVVAGNHVSGNYQTGGVQVTKNLGSCDHPTGGVSLSINVGQGNFNGSRRSH